MPEQFAFQQCIGNGRAVDRYKGRSPAIAVVMHGSATSSLPVPLSSPEINTLALVWDAFLIRLNTCRMSGLCPMIPYELRSNASLWARRRRVCLSMILATTASSSSPVKGLAKYSPAPSRMASTGSGNGWKAGNHDDFRVFEIVPHIFDQIQARGMRHLVVGNDQIHRGVHPGLCPLLPRCRRSRPHNRLHANGGQ